MGSGAVSDVFNQAGNAIGGDVGKAVGGVGNVAQVMYDPLNVVGAGSKMLGQLGPKPLGAVGLAGADERKKEYDRLAAEAAARQKAGQTGAFRDAQLGALAQAQGVASGAMPTAAQQMLQNQQQNNIAQSMAMAASARGGQNAGMNFRQAQQAGLAANQQALAQAMPMQTQERMAANQMVAGIGAQGLGQDLAYQQAQNQQQMMARQAEYEQARDLMNAQMGVGMANKKSEDALKGGLMSTAGQVGAAFLSDMNAKTNIESGKADVRALLDSINAHKYEYKDAKHGAGKHVSVMAQELEKTELGKKMIINTPEGKMVNYAAGAPAILAAAADLHKRVKELEKKKV